MIEIRIHGRGGQGNVVAAYLLATAAFEAGRYCQAFPAFGAERRGAPVVAFVRISDKPIRRRSQVAEPGFLIVQDPTLFKESGLTGGLMTGGGVLVNTTQSSEELSEEMGQAMLALPATALAMEHVGRPVPNVALLAGFLKLTGMMPVDALDRALEGRFEGAVLEKNRALAAEAAGLVEADLWKEAAHAAGA